MGKKIKKEIIDATEEIFGLSNGKHVENSAVNTSTEVVVLSENADNDTATMIKEETVKNNSLVMDSCTTENSCEESETKLLRENIQEWLLRYELLSEDNFEVCLKDLRDIRQKREKVSHMWQSDALYIRELQKRLKWVADKLASHVQKKELIELLKGILHPWDVLQEKCFPDIPKILAGMLDAEVTRKEPFQIRNIRQLPAVLKKVIKSVVSDEERTGQDITDIQEQLEVTMEEHSEYSDSKYQFLVCVGVLQLFGWIPGKFVFEYKLTNYDLDKLSKMLEAHLKNMESMRNDTQKQAYILNLTLCSTGQRSYVIHYVAERLSTDLDEQFREACQNVRVEAGVTNLQIITNNYLRDADNKLMAKSLLYNIKSELRLLFQHQRLPKDPGIMDFAVEKVSSCVEMLLDNLDMKKYYPQRLRYEDVIKLKIDVYDSANKRPAALVEFPWYFLKHIIGLDSDTRENCHKVYTGNDDDDMRDSSESEDDCIGDIHPLDLSYIVFLCADDFLRQELVDKMSKCQYAVPFILPAAEESAQDLLLHWALKGMTRSYCCNGKVVNSSLVDANAPLVLCMHFGKEISLKTKVINKMLSPQQDTFWHQGLPGGDCKQIVSQKMVEVAWYLPGIHKDDRLAFPVTFLNVRQNAKESNLCSLLQRFCSVWCIFVEEINEDLRTFLRTKTDLSKLILLILHKKEDERTIRKESKELQTSFGLEKCQIIRKTSEDGSFNSIYENLRESIKQITKDGTECQPLSTFVKHVQEEKILNVDDEHSYYGQMAAKSILKDIDELNQRIPRSAKATVLPCQSDLKSRQEIAAFDKELCRQRKLKENTTVQKYAIGVKEKKWECQLNQLKKPVSDIFKYFLQCLLSLQSLERKYFLQYLKFGLDERSVEMLYPLTEERKRCRSEEDNSEKDTKLKELDEKITYGSLGIEHFFREMAVMYENMMVLREKAGHANDLDRVLDLMSGSMADVFVEGSALEVMDGDAVTVPVAWLSAVLINVKYSISSSLFKVSVLGAQSSGKSTLLNTIFGLNFPVSGGRCTRGAYMQLVKVEESLKEMVDCDYLAVIDSEGLMSRTKSEDCDFDNELSTFIVGLSDLTLVILRGEGKEMHNVLPLAIHVFLRMNIVGEYQACHFVHQNMGAVDAAATGETEIDAFVRDLDIKTLAAAKDVGLGDQYTKFTDVLHYNPREDNTYVPGLWDGTLPMGKTNSGYAKMLQGLKSDIIASAKDMQVNNRKRLCTFIEVTKRLDELWNAIKYENFVLSFRNVLAVEAHRQLTKVFDEEQWTLKREVQEMIKKEEHIIENEVRKDQLDRTVEQLIEISRSKIVDHILNQDRSIRDKIEHYFQCMGCQDCKSTVKNRHLLSNNEKEFNDEIESLIRTLFKELNTNMENLEVRMKTDLSIHRLSTEMDANLKQKVGEAIKSQKGQNFTQQAIERMFDGLWHEATRDILKTARRLEKDEGIEAVVQATIVSILGPDRHFFLQRHSGQHAKRLRCSNVSNKVSFKVKSLAHMKLIRCHILDQFSHITTQDIQRLQSKSEKIINQTKKHYDIAPSEGKHFNQRDVEVLFVNVLDQIKNISDERFKVTPDYQADLVYHIETLAVVGFTKMHETYWNRNSPEALLTKKRTIFHDLFIAEMGQGDVATDFCDNVLLSTILKNIGKISNTELLHELRVHCGEMFRDIKSIQASIMVDLFKQNQFENYIEYIDDYETAMKEKLEFESTQYFDSKDRLKKLAFAKLDHIVNTLEEALIATEKSTCNGSEYFKTFLSKIDGLKISHTKTDLYTGLSVPDKHQFGQIVNLHLKSRVKERATKIIQAWDVPRKLRLNGLTEFLFKEIVGCTAVCPFCEVPCDTHSGGKTHGNHSATLHRPKGLGGVIFTSTEELTCDDCCSAVASDQIFLHGKNREKSTPYKKYYKLYPKWTIYGDSDPDVEKYWKWVFSQHNEDFAEYYSAYPAELPSHWSTYEKQDIIKDIEDHYYVKLDASKV